jgi:uncharacterized membrane protein YqaE (UPF0057 family)
MFGYVIAILLPPVAMVQQGRVGSAILTLLMCITLVLWPVASVWAFVATRGTHIEDKRTARMSR